MLGISEVIANHFLLSMGVLVAVFIVFKLFVRTKIGRKLFDRVKLHFEIRRQGKPVDPLQYLPRR